MLKSDEIFSLIKADHHKVEGLFSKIEKTGERAAKRRDNLYSDLRNDLNLHMEAEEKAVYPLLKRNEATQSIGYEGVEEHEIVKFLLQKLDGTSSDSKEWIAQITALKEVIQHHVKEEENEMFKKMKRAFTDEELQIMAQDFQREKEKPSLRRVEAA